MWCDVIWVNVMQCDVMRCKAMRCDMMRYDVLWGDVMRCYMMSCDVSWCDAMFDVLRSDVKWSDEMSYVWVHVMRCEAMGCDVRLIWCRSSKTDKVLKSNISLEALRNDLLRLAAERRMHRNHGFHCVCTIIITPKWRRELYQQGRKTKVVQKAK